MNQPNFLQLVATRLAEAGFRPFSAESVGEDSTLTLHDAIRSVLVGGSTSSQLPDVAFWEWREIRPFLRNVWTNLNLSVAQIDSRERSAIAWCNEPTRSFDDVRELLHRSSALPLRTTPTATRRPSPRGLVQSAKVAGAIVESLAVLHEISASSYGDLIEGALGDFAEPATDLALLTKIDDQCLLSDSGRDLTDNSTLVPRQLLRAYLKQERQADQRGEFLTFVNFLHSGIVLNNLAGLSDRALLKRLVQIEPEKPGSSYASAVAKILGEE